MLRKITLLFFSLLVGNLSFGQQKTTIEIVESETLQPIEGVLVSIYQSEKLVASGYTARDGQLVTSLSQGFLFIANML